MSMQVEKVINNLISAVLKGDIREIHEARLSIVRLFDAYEADEKYATKRVEELYSVINQSRMRWELCKRGKFAVCDIFDYKGRWEDDEKYFCEETFMEEALEDIDECY